MAAGLAAALKSAFTTPVELIEGHDAIYEVTVGDELVYTNQSKCGAGFPTHEDVITLVAAALGVAPTVVTVPADDETEAPACPVSLGGAVTAEPLPPEAGSG